MKGRSSLVNLSILFLTCLFLLIFSELFLKYFIHPCECPLVTFDAKDNIIKFDTNGPRQGTFSCGPFAKKEGRWRINNQGWNSDIDYATQRDKPLIAIIGDSYIEAFQVDVSKSIAARLREKMAGKFEVYSFGMSGAALSEYLQISRYVRKYFHPDILVINVVHNDFDESLVSGKNFQGHLYVEVLNHQAVEAPVTPFVPLLQRPDAYNRLKTFLVIHSSLFRYLIFNCHFDERIRQIKGFFNQHKAAYNANINVEEVKGKTEEIEIAIDYLIKTFKKENENKKIIFMIDAPRSDIYANKLAQSNVYWMNLLLEKICTKYDVGFLDLTKSFNDSYCRDHKRFNEDFDYHWNEHGHAKAAEALLAYLQNFLGSGLAAEPKAAPLSAPQ